LGVQKEKGWSDTRGDSPRSEHSAVCREEAAGEGPRVCPSRAGSQELLGSAQLWLQQLKTFR